MGSFECYFTGDAKLYCESYEKGSKLAVSAADVDQNKWTHISVGSTIMGQEAFLSLDYNDQVLSSYTINEYVTMKQAYAGNWMVNLGISESNSAFIGGIRDFYFAADYVNMAQAQLLKNNFK